MDSNQILILVIVVLLSLIIVFVSYFIILKTINKKRTKKVDSIFDKEHLVEEESLMNVLDEKKNIDYHNKTQDDERFINNPNNAKIITNKQVSREEKVNPFGVDLVRPSSNEEPVIKDYSQESGNKFFN